MPMLALCSSGPARGPTDADDARLVGPLRPSKGLPMLVLSGRSGPARGQLMLLMLALRGSGAARGPTDADARLVGPLRPSKGPADAADARFVRLRRSKGPNWACRGVLRGCRVQGLLFRR